MKGIGVVTKTRTALTSNLSVVEAASGLGVREGLDPPIVGGII